MTLNVQRRHLTREQRAALVERYLKAFLDRSDTAVGRAVGVSDKTVAKKRRDLESRPEMPAQTTRIDTKGRAQPARKGRSENPNASAKPSTPTPAQPPEAVVEQFQAACIGIHQLDERQRLSPGLAYDVNTRALSVVKVTLPKLREPERRKATEDLGQLLVKDGAA